MLPELFSETLGHLESCQALGCLRNGADQVVGTGTGRKKPLWYGNIPFLQDSVSFKGI